MAESDCASLNVVDLRLRGILNDYRNIEVLHPTVSKLFSSPELRELFFNSLNQDLSIVSARSQNLADHEISLFQKAFAILMRNEDNHVPGIELYVDELLGLNLVDESQKEETLRTAVKARDAVQQSMHQIRKSSLHDLRLLTKYLCGSHELTLEAIH